MKNNFSKELFDKIVKIIVENEHPVRIILFGSYAYGNPTKDSDIDILIIKNEIKSKIKETQRIRKLLHNIRIPKDIILTTPQNFSFYKTECGSIYKDIDNNGIVLYG